MRTFIECDTCGSFVSRSNIKKHLTGKKCKSGGKQTPKPSKECIYCSLEFSSSSGRGVHEVQCEKNPNRRILNLGKQAWNKGKKSKPDYRDPKFVGQLGGYRPNAGRSKKFKVYNSFGDITTLQSTYEYACFEILCELGLRWIRPKALKYDNRNYFADFYLIDFDIYLDPKNNYKAKKDKDKISKVIEQNNCKVFVLLEHQIKKDYILTLI